MSNSDYKQEIQQQADKICTALVIVFYMFGLLLATWYQTWWFGVGIGTANLFLFGLARVFISSSLWSRMIVSLVFGVFVTQFIGQTHGMYEAHFFFFTNIAILIVYQDWKLFIPFTLVTLAHHSIFFYFQLEGHTEVGQYFSNLYTTQITPTLLGLASVMVAICAWISIILAKKSKENYEIKIANQIHIKKLEETLEWIENISTSDYEKINNKQLENIEVKGILKNTKEKLIQAKNIELKEKFVNIGLTEIAHILTEHDYELEPLCKQLLNKIMSYFKAQQGTLYLIEEQDEQIWLQLYAAYACQPEQYGSKIFQMNEGLLGQCASTRKTLIMNKIPPSYSKISAGLGEIPPVTVLAIPIQTHEEIVGVLEISSVYLLEEYKIELLERMGDSIASSIMGIRFNSKTASLLLESNNITLLLQAQELEIKENLVQMKNEEIVSAKKIREYEEIVTNLRLQMYQRK